MSTKTVKKNRLYDVSLNEISLVDAGANADARVVLMKRDEDNMEVEKTEGQPAAPEAPVAPVTETQGEDLSALTKALEDAEAALEELSKGLDEASDEIERLAGENETLAAENEILKGDIAKRDVPVEDVLKGVDEPVRKAFEALEARLNAAEAVAKRAAEEAETGEYIAKARAFGNLPVAAEVLGPILRRVRKNESTEQDLGELERVLTAANAALEGPGAVSKGEGAVEKKGLFEEVGKRGAEGVTAADRINQAAKEIRKSAPNLSEAEAFTKALDQTPALYSEYLAERRK